MNAFCNDVRQAQGRVALVPTMGALHAGHVSLITAARDQGGEVVVSIFVNPKQFGETQDLVSYPRDLEADLAVCREHRVSAVFAPEASAMYPASEATTVSVAGFSRNLCGATRPGHFDGVATIVTKLFSLAGPCLAVFGKKDYQQFRVVSRLVSDLFLPVELLGVATVREPDGLALSSRNLRLSSGERRAALGIIQALRAVSKRHQAGDLRLEEVAAAASRLMVASALRVDYAELVDADTLSPYRGESSGDWLLAVAAFAGEVRLIDNIALGATSRRLVQEGRHS